MSTTVKISRSELIKWINEILCVNIQSLDRIYNGIYETNFSR